MSVVYHLKLSRKSIKGARFALLPGDPGRVPLIASAIDNEGCVEIASNREFRTWLTYMDSHPVVITSTGIGGPSAAIAIEELAQLGINTFIRVGTTGALQRHIKAGDVVITTASVRMDGTSEHYAPIEYPAVANYVVLDALVQAANSLKIRCHTGITASSATFYPGQERMDTFSKYVIRDLAGSKKEWEHLGVLNYEMESATLLTMCNALGLRAGCVTGVISERSQKEKIVEGMIKTAEGNAIAVAVGAVKHLLTGINPP
ncbi:MAG: uridine phosphorylase [Nitrospirae bacterium]|nr:uridine phosphorylase [Nitrospirota bacterium]